MGFRTRHLPLCVARVEGQSQRCTDSCMVEERRFLTPSCSPLCTQPDVKACTLSSDISFDRFRSEDAPERIINLDFFIQANVTFDVGRGKSFAASLWRRGAAARPGSTV